MRGAVRHFIEAATPYKVCEAVGDGVSAIRKAIEARCDLILLHLSAPLQDILVTVSVLRSKLPHVKIVGLSTLSFDLGDQVSQASGFDVVIAQEDGLSKLVETLKALTTCPRLSLEFTRTLKPLSDLSRTMQGSLSIRPIRLTTIRLPRFFKVTRFDRRGSGVAGIDIAPQEVFCSVPGKA